LKVERGKEQSDLRCGAPNPRQNNSAQRDNRDYRVLRASTTKRGDFRLSKWN
jgi:hypothetical protein